jgi:magnesium transporter
MLRFDRNAASDLMSLNYVIIHEKDSVDKAKELVKKHIHKTTKTPTILVLNGEGVAGELPIYVLFQKGKISVKKNIRKTPCIRFDEKTSEIIKTFRKNHNKKIVVLDDDNSIMGIISAKDVITIMDKKTTEDIYSFAGVKKEEDILDSAFTKVKYRYRWLIINLFTAFLAASVVGLFQESISKLVVLAVYLPIVAGMGGNAGTQTLAVVVRGLALREITGKNKGKILLNEVSAGMINGLLTGCLVAIVSMLLNHSYMLGVVIAMSLIINLMIAAFFATIIPLLLKKLGFDPASASSIFITTATDIFGFFIFLGLATVLLL